MKKTIITVMVSLLLFSCGNNSIGQQIKIGAQTWSTKNLDVSTFRNGDAIPEARTNSEWEKAGKEGNPAWCYYDNDPANGKKYGKLYNWYVVIDPRGLAPKGWHIPSDKEWTTLTDYLGGEDIAGTKMKNSSGWEDNDNGSNSSGFAGLPGGYRSLYGMFDLIDYVGSWWSSSEVNTYNAWYRSLNSFKDKDKANRSNCFKEDGISVRCLGD